MPAIGAAVAAAAGALSGGASAIAGALAAAGAFAAANVGTVLAVAAFAITALTKKEPEVPFSAAAARRIQTFREPIVPRRSVYGEVRASGPILYLNATGDNNRYFHLVVALAGHQVEEIGDFYIDDDLVPLDDDGNATGHFAGHVRVRKHLGLPDQSADPDLVAESNNWTVDHRLLGIAYLYVRLKYNSNLFTAGVPNMSAIVKGKRVYDPRIQDTIYSTNPALCILDYMTDTQLGLGIPLKRINTATVIASANICDESIQHADGSSSARYTSDGTWTTDTSPEEILSQLKSSMAGDIIKASGQWFIHAGAYRTPTIHYDESDLTGPLKVSPKLSRRESANGVKGVYTDPHNEWQPTDYPPIQNETYLAEDHGRELFKEVDLPYTTDAATAQYIANVELEKSRRQLRVSLLVNLRGLLVQAGDTCFVSNARLGWDRKVFEVTNHRFTRENKDGAPVLSVELSLRETDAAIYQSLGEQTVILDPTPTTNVPNTVSIPDEPPPEPDPQPAV